MTGPVPRQSFEDEARCDATSDARLNHLGRPQMAGETPDSTHQPRLAVPNRRRRHSGNLLLSSPPRHISGTLERAKPQARNSDVLLQFVDVIWAWRPGHESTDSICTSPLSPYARDFACRGRPRQVPQESANRCAHVSPVLDRPVSATGRNVAASRAIRRDLARTLDPRAPGRNQ